jgi:hypothetical protein
MIRCICILTKIVEENYIEDEKTSHIFVNKYMLYESSKKNFYKFFF